ncbi:YigZ family protein [Helicobacter sp. MIT 01-3238]|uniref:YigZ family protein n=1 Tax=Helicobacter sp. MIT 01-3238 TaxID=398627 RepID=UPI000E1E82C8|nr:YigZ family protein [Helicobacter sp. MIT 01-3238]RDU55384.1 hypothetical protein CQA40_00995 [Helicobacter sp. MIT 01-3238]
MQTIDFGVDSSLGGFGDDFTKTPLSLYEVKGSRFLGFGIKIIAPNNEVSKNADENSGQSKQKAKESKESSPLQNPLQPYLNGLKKAHPKAVHFVYAYRVINSLEQVIERSSDDGEPKGSSGQPCLNVLRGWEMVDFGIIIVRYFGGVKLGVGGLVRAYTKATLEAIHTLKSSQKIVQYERREMQNLSVKYSELNALKHILKAHNLAIQKEEFLSECVELVLCGSEVQMSAFNAWVVKNKHLFL